MNVSRWPHSARRSLAAVGPDLLLPDEGGPTAWRRVTDPPPREIETETGLLVLNASGDAGLRDVDTPR